MVKIESQCREWEKRSDSWISKKFKKWWQKRCTPNDRKRGNKKSTSIYQHCLIDCPRYRIPRCKAYDNAWRCWVQFLGSEMEINFTNILLIWWQNVLNNESFKIVWMKSVCSIILDLMYLEKSCEYTDIRTYTCTYTYNQDSTYRSIEFILCRLNIQYDCQNKVP